MYKVAIDIVAQTQQLTQELNKASGLIGKMGAAITGFFAFDMLKDAAMQVFEFGKEIEAVRSQVSKMTGLTGSELNSMTGAVKATASTFGAETNEIIQAANNMSKNMGISFAQANKLIREGFATGANASGEFMDMVREYPAMFHDAGMSAEQMIAIMSQSVKEGIYSDKGADAIKEGMLRLREMTPATADALNGIGISSKKLQTDLAKGNISVFQAIQQVSNKLATLPPQSSKVGTALADIFGGAGEDAGLRYITMLGKMDTSMSALIAKQNESAKAQLEQAAATEKLTSMWSSLFGGSSVWFTKLKTAVMEFAVKAIEGIVDVINYFIELYNESTAFRWIIQGIKASFKNTFDFIAFTIAEVGNRFKTIGKILEAIFKGEFAKIPGILDQSADKTTQNVKKLGTSVAQNLKDGFNAALNPKEKIKLVSLTEGAPSGDAEQTGKTVGKSFADGLANGLQVQKVMDELRKQFQQITNQSQVWGDAIDVVAEKKKALQTAINKLIEAGVKPESQSITNLLQQYRDLGSVQPFPDSPLKSITTATVTQKSTTDFQSVKKLPATSFDKQTAEMAALQQVLQTVGMQFNIASQNAALFGTQTDLIAEKKSILQGAIAQLVEQGFTIEGTAITTLMEQYTAFYNMQTGINGAMAEFGTTMMENAKTGAKSFKELAKSAANAARNIIRAQIAEGIAGAIAKALTSVPAPYNLILAGIAGATAATLFNTLIPEFAGGGIVSGTTLGIMGEYPGAKSNPEVIAPLNKLQNLIEPQGAMPQKI
jgi:TP901 family phage tail tape measure protein